MSVALALVFGKPENKPTIQTTVVENEVQLQDSQKTEKAKGSAKVTPNEFINYLNTPLNGGFDMSERKDNSNSHIGISNDWLNDIEFIELNMEIQKVIIRSYGGPEKFDNALSAIRPFTIANFLNGNDQDAAKWMYEQLPPKKLGYVAISTVNNVNYKITYDSVGKSLENGVEQERSILEITF